MGWVSLVCAFGFTTQAFAVINLKKVQITDGSQIELIFDGKIGSNQIKTEFVRDNIQLSLSDVSVYPAKVSMVSGMELTKVFAYQYAPKLVRARFTVKGDASQYQNRIQVKTNGKIVTVRLLPGGKDQVAASASSAERASKDVEKVAKEEPTPQKEAELSGEEKMLLDRVISNAQSKAEKNEEKADAKEAASDTKENAKNKKSGQLTSGKPLPSPMRSIGVMLFIVGLLGLFLMFMKRLKGGSMNAKVKNAKGLTGLLGKISGNLANRNMIEVISTHNLGPKKSIVMVKIQNRMLVLGMTNDSVNLITEFKANESEEEVDEELADSLDVSDFAEGLKKFEKSEGPAFGASPAKKSALGDLAAAALGMKKPAPKAPAVTTAANRAVASAYASAGSKAPAGANAAGVPAFAEVMKTESTKPSIRAQIKSRVEGMKQL